jgi:DtxR family transcriptional regulator, Mn-dependent transcriptional regulator
MLESRSAEDFLKAVYVLQNHTETPLTRVSTNALAEALNIKAPSITDMARRLETSGYVNYRKYRGVTLTEQGRDIALKVIRRHRLLELYLVRELGYALHEVHDEAEVLEHNVSDRFVQAIDDKMGNPELDPHGDPIPTPEGKVFYRDLIPLTEIALSQPATVARIKTGQNDMIEHIIERGLRLNAPIEVIERDPFEGPLTVRVDDRQCVLGHNVAAAVWVLPQDESQA